MPDIPTDFLFIVGLLLASLVGKLMEGRAKSKKTVPGSEPSSSLGRNEDDPKDKKLSDILRETFGEVIEPIPEDIAVFEETNDQLVESPKPSQLQSKINKDYSRNAERQNSSNALDLDKYQSTREWVLKEAFNSKKSLRRSFIVKEVLDHPPGLRRSFF